MLTSVIEEAMDQDRIDVVRGLHRTDPDVIATLIERYQHRLFRYLMALAGDQTVASDIFQETWLRVLERGHTYKARFPFDTWLFTVARNLFLDRIRKTGTLSLDELTEPNRGGRLQPESNQISPLDALVADEERDAISVALSRLPPAQREVLVLRFREDLSLVQIATIVDAPLPTVKSRLYRGLETLRTIIQERS